MLVSIIVPVYNVKKYLRECLDSLLRQSYRNIEVIMIDDGSTDGSGEICDEYAERYEHFLVYHKQNGGLGMARNTGLEHISGQYVTFLDSDDYLEPTYVEALCRGMGKQRVDMCKGGFRRVTDAKRVVLTRQYKDECYLGKTAGERLLPRMIGSSPSRHDSVEMCVCGGLYNNAIIQKHHIRFSSERELISEDMVFNIDYMQYADGACLISDTGYNYRVNGESLTTRYRADRFEACRRFYLVIKAKLESLGYGRDTILRLQRAFFIYIRMCIAQEDGRRASRTRSSCEKSIKKICEDSLVREVIREYPTEKLGLAQRTFLRMIERKLYRVLYLISHVGWL